MQLNKARGDNGDDIHTTNLEKHLKKCLYLFKTTILYSGNTLFNTIMIFLQVIAEDKVTHYFLEASLYGKLTMIVEE